jgi:hypothetical protein
LEEALDKLTNRLLHLHVPKTAGTALRDAFKKARGGSLRIFPHYDERQFKGINADDYDVFSGHFGFKTASEIGGDIITILRNPVDRFLSVYYFWRELHASGAEISPNTIIASKYSINDFVTIRDEPFMLEEFFNRVTWQIAYGSSLNHRREMRISGRSDQQIYQMAVTNLSKFAVVGIQEDIPAFVRQFARKTDLEISVDKINVTKHRFAIDDINVRTLREIHDWLYLDLKLYAHATAIADYRAKPQ